MKLYTKEMFLHAAEKCEVSMIDAKHIMKYIDEYVTPIEVKSEIPINLPSDEEIEKEASSKYPLEEIIGLYMSSEDFDKQVKQEAFIDGAKWMKEQILGKEDKTFKQKSKWTKL